MWHRSENQVRLVWIRHGATKANEEHRYLGKTDEALSKSGRKTLLAYREHNDYPDVKYLFTSPMKRCLQTAEILYPELHPIIIPEWEEIDFGRFENKNYEQLKEDAQYQAWVDSGGTLDFPEGESREKFIMRCESGFIKMCTEFEQKTVQKEKAPLSAAMIVHGGTIMALLSTHGEKGYFDYQAANGRGYLCKMLGWGTSARFEEVDKL